tara:strand:+ start:187 stop:813 length:627 start_codon:yes stop_codon:yes gene_type:complete
MNYDHVFVKSDIVSLLAARLIQLNSTDSILMLHPNAEIGMPTTSCGLFSSPEVLDRLELGSIPASVCISRTSLRSEWFEKHLAIVLANNGAEISTRASLNIVSRNQGIITGSSSITGEIGYEILHDIVIPTSNSHQWYCNIHTNPPPSEIIFFSQRSDESFESWSKENIRVPSTFEHRVGTGTITSPNTIDLNLEIATNYVDQSLNIE